MIGISRTASALAKWHRSQWLQDWPNNCFEPVGLAWHGITNSSAPTFGEASDITATAVFMDSPNNGMTAAVAPAIGSQIIIQIINSLRKNGIFIKTEVMRVSSLVMYDVNLQNAPFKI